jgi:hypothetical protein
VKARALAEINNELNGLLAQQDLIKQEGLKSKFQFMIDIMGSVMKDVEEAWGESEFFYFGDELREHARQVFSILSQFPSGYEISSDELFVISKLMNIPSGLGPREGYRFSEEQSFQCLNYLRLVLSNAQQAAILEKLNSQIKGD